MKNTLTANIEVTAPQAYQELAGTLAQYGVTLMQGDSKEKMAEMRENSVDAIVTDPPYGLTDTLNTEELLSHWLSGREYNSHGKGFMDKEWDS